MICRIIGFFIGVILTVVLMLYLTWGDMGIVKPGDMWGLARFYTLFGGAWGAWIIGDKLKKVIGAK